MEQRITRAKAKIKAARIPYRVPSAEDLPARVSGVLAVLFLVFNEGYLATGPDTDPVRHDLTAEAIRLTRLIRALMPGSLPDPRRDQRRAHLRPRRTGHRLVAGRRPLRPARPPRSLADHRPQPGHRGRRA